MSARLRDVLLLPVVVVVHLGIRAVGVLDRIQMGLEDQP